MDIFKLKATRAGNRAVITKICKKISDIAGTADSDTGYPEFSDLLEVIQRKRTLLQKLDEDILQATSTDDTETEIVDTDEYYLELDSQLRNFKTLMKLSRHTQNSSVDLNPQAPEFTSQSSLYFQPQYIPQNISNSVVSSTSQNHRLPKLFLPKFSGDVLDWQTFWESFETTVHLNHTLTDVQKFCYLKSLLEGSAANVITGLSLTNMNYFKAIEILRERFGQTHKIINAYMKALLELPAPLSNLSSLRDFHNKSEAYIRGLESLEQGQEKYGSLLIPVILGKLPNDTRMNITRQHGNDKWDIQSLRHAISHEISILETGNHVNSELNFVPTANFHAAASKTNTTRRNTIFKVPQYEAKSDNKAVRNKNQQCVYCNNSHFTSECSLTLNERLAYVKEKHLCFNCLGHHRVSECRSNRKCRKCKHKHHTSLCKLNSTNTWHVSSNKESATPVDTNQIENKAETQSKESKPRSVLYSSAIKDESVVLLKTAVATVSSGIHCVETNILFDEGAQRSFITENLANKLQLKATGRETLNIASFGDQQQILRHLNTATVYLEADNGEKIQIDVLIVPTIAAPIVTNRQSIVKNSYLRNLKLAHPVTEESSFTISLLIGADFYWDIVGDEIIRGNGPTAVSSKIGHLISGPTNGKLKPKNVQIYNILTYHKLEEIDLERFWKVEDLDYPKNKSIPGDELITFQDGYYTAKLPWKPEVNELPTNMDIAKHRTRNTIRRLSRDPKLLEIYGNIIKEQEKLGFIEKVETDHDMEKPVHYIPHHAVKKDSATTPIRIVYDCSCRANSESFSLNDCLKSTPPQLNDITSILTRFRAGKHAVTTDIEKAFLQIRLHEPDRNMTRFFWLKDPSNADSDLITYRFRVVLFGATCSPFLLNATLMKHVNENPGDVSKELSDSIYVDNVLTSFDCEDSALKFYSESRKLLSTAGFNLRSWNSNNDKIREIAKKEGVFDIDNPVKILGLRWNVNNDSITYPTLNIEQDKECVTKRVALSQSAKTFDPLGILSPVTVRVKILMQDIWRRKMKWDECLPEDLQKRWNILAKDLITCATVEIPRYLFNNENMDSTLHVFTDASMKAYGACAYLVCGEESNLIMAKNKVAPMKEITLPRLELMAALLGSRLATHITSVLPVKSVIFWSDSQIVLHWIKSNKPLAKFIMNRKREIENLTKKHVWKYVPTDSNPADLQTRGISQQEYANSTVWMKGPKWITDESAWPIWEVCSTSALLSQDIEKECQQILLCETSTSGVNDVIDIGQYSTLGKLLRVTSYVLRFIRNCKESRNYRRLRKRSATDVECPHIFEIQESMTLWIKEIQKQKFAKELDDIKNEKGQNSLVKQLRLYIDNKGIIRSRGRIDNSSLKESTKNPILLAKKHHFSDLVIGEAHKRNLHSGCAQTVSDIRQSYWIPSIRQVVNHILRKCVTCRKVSGKPYSLPTPPQLPKDRVLDCTPFAVTGVDYAGPLHIKSGKQLQKSYICLFTCATTRAIHLELVQDLSVDTFVLAFRRFISNKHTPHTMYSDNGTTFQAASKVLSETININVKWKFITKGAPWHGGFWERMVGITKNVIRKVLGKCLVDEVILRTVLCEVETVINNRPITHVSSNVSDPEPLTPSHLLSGRRKNIQYFDGPEDSPDVNTLNKETANILYGRKLDLITHFTRRWKHEYLTNLREFHSTSGKNEQSVNVGDIVQVHDLCPRVQWKIGKITEVIMGNDNLIRSAKIRMGNGRVTSRPISKLFPLELR